VSRSPDGRPETRTIATLRRSVGSPLLFSIVYTPLASALYFSLGVISGHALGLTPLVFVIAALFFTVTAMTYAEGTSMHPERSGSTVFARYAFNELVSFIAGWAILLDYTILIAVTAYSATHYLRVFWGPLGHSVESLLLALAIIAFVVLVNIRGIGPRRARRIGMLVLADLAVQVLLIVLGLVLFFSPDTLVDPIDLGSAPTWSGLVFALTIAVIAFTSLESAAGVAGEVRVGRRALKRVVASGAAAVMLVYTGIALVAVTAFPVHGGHTELATRFENAPMVGIVTRVHPHGLEETLRYLIALLATMTLIAASNAAMLGLSRLAYSLSTNRQIPSALGRLHPTRSTPYVLILIAGAIAAGLVAPESLDFLIGIYAFGAMLAFTIAHVSLIRLRRLEPDRDRPYRIPLTVTVRGHEVPLPAALGALASAAGWIAVMVVHEPARYVGWGWMLGGVLLYVIYRRADEAPLLRRVTVAPEVLRPEPPRERDYGSILAAISPAPRPRIATRTPPIRSPATTGKPRRSPRRDGTRGFPRSRSRERARRSRVRSSSARSTRGCRSRRRPCAPGGRATRSWTRHAGAGWKRSCSGRRSRRGSAAERGLAGGAGSRITSAT